MPASCVFAFARMPVHSSGLVSEGQPTFRLYAARIASRLARGVAPSNPEDVQEPAGHMAMTGYPYTDMGLLVSGAFFVWHLAMDCP